METCPNCRESVIDFCSGSSYSVTDKYGRSYLFHGKCYIDVVTGWSGSIHVPLSGETFEDGYRRVMKINFGCVGVELR